MSTNTKTKSKTKKQRKDRKQLIKLGLRRFLEEDDNDKQKGK